MRVDQPETIAREKLTAGLYWAKVEGKVVMVEVAGTAPFLRCCYYVDRAAGMNPDSVMFLKAIDVPKG